MTFDEKLNDYIALLGCTQKELAQASGLSPTVVSRYCTGVRTPNADTEVLERLIGGIVRLAEEKGNGELTRDSVSQAFSAIFAESDLPYERLRENLNALLSALSVSLADLSRATSYNASSLSRIRNGQRRPADIASFSGEVARYIVRRYSDHNDRAALARLLGCKAGELKEDSVCTRRLAEWLFSGENTRGDDIVFPFLAKVDGFDLDEFTSGIRFDKLKIPSVPFQFPGSKSYRGLAQMRQGYLDFFKTAVLSRSREPLIINDDTPIADLTEGTDFKRQFAFAVALTLKKGLHINMIHDVNRPFREMMMGLEGWLPMYMTGQVSPYYLKGIHNKIFGHVLFSSGTAALSGECIMGYHDSGKFYLTNNRGEAGYYRARAKNLLSKASPLMNIYRVETGDQYRAFLQEDEDTPGNRRSILSAPPLYTLSDGLLARIVERSGQSEAAREQILALAAAQRDRMERILERDTATDELPTVTEAEFAEHPMSLPLSALFHETDILYTCEEYLEHLEQTKAYAAAHPNYTVKFTGAYPFHNIQIVIHEGNWAVISKNKAPAIHFVIRHPKLLSAIENFIPPAANQREISAESPQM